VNPLYLTRTLALSVVAGGVLAAGSMTPALAATCAAGTTTTAVNCPTIVTFDVTSGSLTINVPLTATLTGVTDSVDGAKATGSLGAVTVTDNRGTGFTGWTTKVSATDFTNSPVTTTLPVSGVTYTSGTATPTLGSGTLTSSPTLNGLSAAQTAVTFASTANSRVTWNPTVTVDVPANTPADTYSGTIFHSVA
jgi:hypothetical protein